jgi:hypothetical protein
MPKTDNAEPIRTNVRRAMEDPRLKKSSTAIEDASRVKPNTDIDEPNRAKVRRDKAEPKLGKSNTERDAPMRAMP